MLITTETTIFHKLHPFLNKMKGRIKAKKFKLPLFVAYKRNHKQIRNCSIFNKKASRYEDKKGDLAAKQKGKKLKWKTAKPR